ncbi:hypothetical protein IDJ75_09940 [Mucilaginibacter rigui]|uniref:Uncharacterized protein n=1 Tax=Mucilaginibacter rigui TaxID=534635 RepID=A0ABR7X4U0_9SPHI|nr:DUF6624 domain-containing protein [Mucilaginibacter rigui]MBD1385597.1 hypothetical protein [Mucilaginibacter rigui]
MKKTFLILLLVSGYVIAFGQVKTDSVLYKKLSAMFKEDQKWRIESAKLYNHQKSEYDRETVDKNWSIADSTNEAEAKRILNKYGFPGYSLVGQSGSSKFWAIVQHCDDNVAFQQKVLLLMKKEVDRKNASGENYAYLTDRVLTNLNQKQLYGTQGIYDPKTKKWAPLPIKDAAHVEARRKALGMISLKQYIADTNAAN